MRHLEVINCRGYDAGIEKRSWQSLSAKLPRIWTLSDRADWKFVAPHSL